MQGWHGARKVPLAASAGIPAEGLDRATPGTTKVPKASGDAEASENATT